MVSVVPVEFVHDLKFRDLPAPIVAAAIRALTDTLGVAIAGSTTDLSRIIRNHAAAHFGAGENGSAQLWMDGRSVSPPGAALANGMTIDSLDAHDGHKLIKGHVGCGTIPALFAMAQATNQFNTEELIASLVMAYEIGTRAGIALHATACDYHTSGAWVALATAAIGARSLGLSCEQTREALGIAEYHGPRSQMMRTIDHPTMVKDGSGWGAMAGLSAAYLAREGFTGAPAISIEAEDVAAIWSDLRAKWYVDEQYIKLYPVCRWAQPPVEAALSLMRSNSFRLEEVEAITITSFHEALRLATRHPENTEQAQYSLPFSVSAAMVHGTIGAEHVGTTGLSDSRMAQLREKIEVVESDEFNSEFPARRIAQVDIKLSNGRVLVSEPTEALGDPESPLDEEQICAKFIEFTGPVLGQRAAKSFHNRLTNINDEASISFIMEQLAKTRAHQV